MKKFWFLVLCFLTRCLVIQSSVLKYEISEKRAEKLEQTRICYISDIPMINGNLDVDCDREVKDGVVVENTKCFLYNPDDNINSEIECVHAQWVPIGKFTGTEIHHRHKRFFWFVVGALAVTAAAVAICSEYCGGSQSVTQVDNPPTLTCPTVQGPLYADQGQVSKTVTWSPPTANDPEQGDITSKVQLESGLPSGSAFPRGDHTTVYMVEDDRGNRDYCDVKFTVIVISCTPLATPSNGIQNCNRNEVIYGTTCTFQCNQGYALTGSPSLLCSQSGSFGGSVPTCERVQCQPLGQPNNGHIVCSDIYNYQSVCRVVCDTGYDVGAVSTSVCNADRTWSTDLSNCIDSKSPTFTSCPERINVYAERAVSYANVTWTIPEATDNSGGQVIVTQTKGDPVDSQFTVGVHEIRYQAADQQGNVSPDCTFFINVQQRYCTGRFQDVKLIYTCPNNNPIYGVNCSLSCSGNYPLIGNSTVTCDIDPTDQTSGVWDTGSPDEPFCQENQCPDLNPPINGALVCDTAGINKFCQMQCNIEYDIPRGVTPGQYFVCGDSNVWSLGGLEQVPDCTDRRRPGTMLLPGEIYYFTGDCNNLDVQEDIKQNFITLFQDLENKGWTNLCSSNGCNISSVEVTCGEITGRRRRGTDFEYAKLHRTKRQTHQIIVRFSIENTWVSTNLSTSDEFTHNEDLIINFFNNMIKPLVDNGNLTVGNFSASSAEYGWSEISCSVGQTPRYSTLTCAGCPTGTFYNSTLGSCQSCPIGTYQDEDSRITCKTCQVATTTADEGSKNISQCIDICTEGTYSSTGYQPCFPCPIGQYQPETSATSCLSCDIALTTERTGCTNQSQCKDFDLESSTIGSYVVFNNLTSPVSDFTLIFFVYIPSSTDSKPRITVHRDGVLDFQVTIDDTVGIIIHGENIQTSVPVNVSVWTQFTMTWDSTAGTIEVFKQGVSVYTQTISSIQSRQINTGSSLKVTTASSGQITGWKLSALAMYDRKLTSTEIIALSSTCAPSLSNPLYRMADLKSSQSSGISLVAPSSCDAIDECASDPCGGHNCINTVSGYTCQCNDGYSGTHCETAPDYCANNLCTNGATCSNQLSNYTCGCPTGYRGELCQIAIINGEWSEWQSWSECTTTCGGGTIVRNRTCNNPPPDSDGLYCSGSDTETAICNAEACPACPSFDTVKQDGNDVTCIHTDGYDVCKVTCQPGLVFETNTNHTSIDYICGQNTSYTWATEPAKCLVLESPSSLGLQLNSTYRDFPCGQESNVKQGITDNLVNDNSLHCIVNGTCSVSVSLSGCAAADTTEDVRVTVTLYTTLQAGNNLDLATVVSQNQSNQNVEALVTAMATLEATYTQVETLSAASVFGVTVGGNTILSEEYQTSPLTVCPSGTVPSQIFCVECPTGTYQSERICLLCPKGTYQELTKQSDCMSCPLGYTTLYTGSDNAFDCSEEVISTSTTAEINISSVMQPRPPPSFTSEKPKTKQSVPDAWKIGLTIGCVIGFLAMSVVSAILYYNIRKYNRRINRRRSQSSNFGSQGMVRPDTASSIRPGSALSANKIAFTIDSSPPQYDFLFPNFESTTKPPISHFELPPLCKNKEDLVIEDLK